MTVRELRRTMPAAEYVEWVAFYEERGRRIDQVQKQAGKKAEIESRRRGR